VKLNRIGAVAVTSDHRRNTHEARSSNASKEGIIHSEVLLFLSGLFVPNNVRPED
jgi:hypothetical protein